MKISINKENNYFLINIYNKIRDLEPQLEDIIEEKFNIKMKQMKKEPKKQKTKRSNQSKASIRKLNT